MDIEKVLIPVITAISGGIVTYLFGRIQERSKDKKTNFSKLEEQRKERPEFVITEMKDFFNRPGAGINSHPCDIEIFVTGIRKVNIIENDVFAEYDDSISDKKLWVCRVYTLKNVGKTVVYSVNIISNFKRSTCIFNTNIIDQIVDSGILNYSELLDKRIAPNESFTLKLCYHKDKISAGFASAILEIGMQDDNYSCWFQPFFAPENKLYESRKIDNREYRDAIRPDTAIECFQKPYLW